MNKWLSNVVQGGDIDTDNSPAGVELKSVTPQMFDGFMQLIIPKLNQRPDVIVHVLTKEFIGTSMRITIATKPGVPPRTPKEVTSTVPISPPPPPQSPPRSEVWDINSIESILAP